MEAVVSWQFLLQPSSCVVIWLQKYIKIFGFLRLVNKKVKTMLIFTGRNEVCAILPPQVTLCLTGLVS
ncbi:MAG: hypothetical protein J5529_07475, partial [Prevotella sp.]|nr:hypothetical protein [Prevotella sp.]